MKKIFSFALCALALVAATSCKKDEPKPQPTPGEDVTITVNPKTLSMSVEDQERLSATVKPEGTTLELKWTSSNTDVATVTGGGLVTAVAEGEALIIVSAEGAKADTCVVSVSNTAVLDAYDYADFGLFGQEIDYVDGTDTVLTLSDGDYKCKIGYISIYGWDGNLSYVRGTGFTGAGFLTYAYVPMYWITEGTYAGYYIGGGGFAVADCGGEIIPYVAEAGTIDVEKYGQFIDSYLTEEQKENPDGNNIRWDLYSEAAVGAQVWYVDYTDPDDPYFSVDYGSIYANVERLAVIDTSDVEPFTYEADLQWLDFLSNNRFRGLAIEYDADSIASCVQPYDMKYIPRHYGSETAAGAPKFCKGNMAKRYNEMPELPKTGRILTKDKFYRK